MPSLPQIHLVRHGETTWSLSRQHTGRSDIPLTEVGEDAAKRLAERLSGERFAAIMSSPSQRALQTARLAGFGSETVSAEDLAEWDYGDYEGRTTKEASPQGLYARQRFFGHNANVDQAVAARRY